LAAAERRRALVWNRRVAHALPLCVRRARCSTGAVLGPMHLDGASACLAWWVRWHRHNGNNTGVLRRCRRRVHLARAGTHFLARQRYSTGQGCQVHLGPNSGEPGSRADPFIYTTLNHIVMKGYCTTKDGVHIILSANRVAAITLTDVVGNRVASVVLPDVVWCAPFAGSAPGRQREEPTRLRSDSTTTK